MSSDRKYGVFLPYPGDNSCMVSDLGYIKNIRTGRITKGHIKGKYLYHTFGKGGRATQVGRMVLETFIGPCPEDCNECHHINIDTTDNRLKNLMWVSHITNNNDPHHLYMLGKLRAKEVQMYNDKGERRVYKSVAEMARKTGMPLSVLYKKVSKNIEYKGWKFIYTNDLNLF